MNVNLRVIFSALINNFMLRLFRQLNQHQDAQAIKVIILHLLVDAAAAAKKRERIPE